jgi:hypothetical protein
MRDINVLVIHYYKSTIDGVMTSLIDAYFNIRRERSSIWNTRMKIICPELYLMDKEDFYNFDLKETQCHEYTKDKGLETKPYEGDYNSLEYHFKCFNNKLTSSIPFLKMNRNFGDFNLLFGIEQKQKKFKADIIVCSARLIYEILNGKDIELECNRLFVLDSLDTYKSKVGIFPDFDDLFDTMFRNCDVWQLSNPANFRETKYRQVEYYHKLSYRRLSALKQSGLIKDKLVFTRTKKAKTMIGENAHFENMGKGIFEHLYFGREVEYKNDGMFTKDGLWHYMRLFDLDATKDQIIKLGKYKIMDKMFYKRNDILFELGE